MINKPLDQWTWRDKLSVWWGLGLRYKWELLGVWCGVRCAACGDWKWRDPCWSPNDPHWSE